MHLNLPATPRHTHRASETETRTDLVILSEPFSSLLPASLLKPLFAKYTVHLPPFQPPPAGEDEPMQESVFQLQKFLETKQITKPVLVGCSLGTKLAINYALKHPVDVASLVLSASAYSQEKTILPGLTKVSTYQQVRESLSQFFYNEKILKRTFVEKIHRSLQKHTEERMGLTHHRNGKSADFKNMPVKNLAMPVLLLWGLQDKITPPHIAHRLYEQMPKSRICLINECGHFPMVEQPVAFVAHLIEFIEHYAPLRYKSTASGL
ncbi:alpha/beta fold hydrolase [Arcticibacter sp. MXS-1]|uniref:alpha/beta fold hydrolase n=1 Tax=Arcticibacter sp. MXS-1 TaxID=3341726 RepID=UPI0035A8A3B8